MRIIDNALVRYDREVRAALAALDAPDRELPPAGPVLTDFFRASGLALADLGDYRGKRLRLLDLMRNPRTRTTKTCASLVIVARAAERVRRTGEPVLLLSPSSGNKATALRDGVLRAYETGLATPDELGAVVVVPGASRHKLWDSPLAADEVLRRRNPVVTFDGAQRADVKLLARELVDGYTAALWDEHGVRLWYTLDIENYMTADVVRACVEREFLPRVDGRLHVHAVSSAYGLLGHDLGARMHGDQSAHYFMVQHLDTADMVLSLHFGSTSRENVPAYRLDESTGLYRQEADPRFPATTFDPDENLDPTFYTRTPPTSAQMDSIIHGRGGGGIVVSLHECLERYPALRVRLAAAGVALPADPRDLREWSLVMVLTGILNAIDRGLVAEDDILVHGSGSYGVADFAPIPAPHLTPVQDVAGLAEVAARAAAAGTTAAGTTAAGTTVAGSAAFVGTR